MPVVSPAVGGAGPGVDSPVSTDYSHRVYSTHIHIQHNTTHGLDIMPPGSRGNTSPSKSGSQKPLKKYKGDLSSQPESDRKTRSNSVEATTIEAIENKKEMQEIPEAEDEEIVDLSSDPVESGSGSSNEENSDQDEATTEAKRRTTKKTKVSPEEEKQKQEEKRRRKEEEKKEEAKMQKIKEDIMGRCEEGEMKTEMSTETEKVAKALIYMQICQKRCTRIPANTRKVIEETVDIVMKSIVRLEVLYQAKTVALEILKPNKGNEEEEENTEEVIKTPRAEEAARTRPKARKAYAEAVKASASTLIIQGKTPRNAEDIEKQITDKIKEHHEGIKKVKGIRNGIKLICDSEEEAQKIKEKITQNEEASAEVSIKTATIRRKKIIIFNIPENITEEQITQKIRRTLQLPTLKNEAIQQLKALKTKEGRKHQPLLLPETLADELLKMRTICLGLRECPVKVFISVTRCHRCLLYDHLATNCKGTQRCTICSGTHNYTECRSKSSKKCCYACTLYNEENKDWLRVKRDTDHASNSSQCHTRRVLMRARQLQEERGQARPTGWDVISGRVTVTTWLGKDRVETRTRQDLVNKQKYDYTRRRHNGGSG